MDTITRAQAKSQGTKTYYTGRLCKRGHDSERSTNTAQCLACRHEDSKREYATKKHEYDARAAQWRQNNRQRYRDTVKRWRDNNNKKAREHSKRTYEKNKESRKASGRLYYQQHANYFIECSKQWARENPHIIRLASQKYRKRNKTYSNQLSAAYRQANQSYYNAWANQRRARKLNATPSWLTEADHQHIQRLYTKASFLTEEHGVSYHVDHIIPLQHKHVCGLHVPANLQVITAEENQTKSNRFEAG